MGQNSRISLRSGQMGANPAPLTVSLTVFRRLTLVFTDHFLSKCAKMRVEFQASKLRLLMSKTVMQTLRVLLTQVDKQKHTYLKPGGIQKHTCVSKTVE